MKKPLPLLLLFLLVLVLLLAISPVSGDLGTEATFWHLIKNWQFQDGTEGGVPISWKAINSSNTGWVDCDENGYCDYVVSKDPDGKKSGIKQVIPGELVPTGEKLRLSVNFSQIEAAPRTILVKVKVKFEDGGPDQVVFLKKGDNPTRTKFQLLPGREVEKITVTLVCGTGCESLGVSEMELGYKTQ